MSYSTPNAAARLPGFGESRSSLTIVDDEWLTTDEAAHYLRISPERLRNMTSQGQVPYYKLGRSNRYLRRELKQLLLAQARGVPNGD